MSRRAVIFYLSVIALLLIVTVGWYAASFLTVEAAPLSFDGSNAYADVQTQVAFGERTPGSAGHVQVREWMRTELESAGWEVEVQQTERMGHSIYNLIAKRGNTPQIILGAHYDSRMFADQDPDVSKRNDPVPAANDGASGVAVLIELARTLPKDTVPVWLVFFDAEDNGHIEGWDWILGSRAFVEDTALHPQAAVIVDMIGDANLNIHLEKNSDPIIRAEIWETADALGYGDVFINTEKFSMLDDHTPFLEAGIPAVDIIDFDYPYWHTTQDTPDKVSTESLHAVGDTLWHWIVNKSPATP